ncbi:MAG: amidophosphoribosyltransferase [Nitrospirae bacterium]|nr:amidophosphoribosyltransferase [Nitrospirota bacterium]
MLNDKPREECGIFGVFGHKDAAELTYLGLYALQHRGQESAGIVVSDGKKVRIQKGMGLVTEVFKQKGLEGYPSHLAIGHVRYSTMGSSSLKNAQPFLVEYSNGSLAIAHNGNLVNAQELRRKLESSGSIFQSTMDSEIVIHLLAKSRKKNLQDRVFEALSQVKGAYSLLFLTEKELIAARDPQGVRPLCLGQLDGTYVIASESCALDLTRAKFLREIEPGEIVFIDEKGLRSFKPFPKERHSFCIFEFIYFARPDSYLFGGNVHLIRRAQGRELAREYSQEADLVMPIPDSGNSAALGFSKESGIPFEMGVIRNHYVGRTFIQPSPYIRDLGVRVKLNPVKEVLKGKRVVIVEDSIVRGTTSRTRIKTLREAGAKEIHMRVSCPPLKYPCFYGIDFPTKEELIASNRSVEEIADFVGLDSLGYLSLEGLFKAMPLPREEFCTACFNGVYPISIPKGMGKHTLERIIS